MKEFSVNVYCNILKHGFGWYDVDVQIFANSVKECIKEINKRYPFESGLLIFNVTDDKLYKTSYTRKSIKRA